jgi:hypothetical protein
MACFPEIEMWSANGPIPDRDLAEMIEASNAYALCEFNDPVSDIYTAMLFSVARYLPQLLQIAADSRKDLYKPGPPV